MTLKIRPATPDDLDTILHFIQTLADYERLDDEMRADTATLGQHLFGPEPMAQVLIAELDGAPVGFALFFHSFSTFEGRPGLYLEDMFVLPEARGRGAGTALLKRLAQIAIKRDCTRLELSVLDWDDRALEFYRALGAHGLNEWTINRIDGAALRALGAADETSDA